MLYRLLMGITIALGGLIPLALVSFTALKSSARLNEFRKRTNGLPLLEGAHWLYNNAFYVVTKDINHFASKMHARLGKTVGWLYRHEFAVSTIDLDLIKLINVTESQAHIGKLKTRLPMREIEESIVSVGGDEWRGARKVFAPALKPQKFMTPVVVDQMQSSIDKFIDYIENCLNNNTADKTSVQLDIDETSHRYSLDLVFRCFFRQRDLIDFNAHDCKWTSTIVSGFRELQESKVIKLAMILPQIVPLIDWLMWHLHPLGKWRRTIMGLVLEQIQNGLEARKCQQVVVVAAAAAAPAPAQASGSSMAKQKHQDANVERNLTDFIIDKFVEGKLTRKQCVNGMCFLMPAADKTSSDSIGHTLYLLATHTRVQVKLRECLKTEGGGAKCEYLGWILHESLRLFPPSSSGSNRVLSREVTTREGYTLPAGTFVTTPAFAIHRLKEYWGEDAEEFKPERWANTSHHHPCQYLAFGSGARVCPGREFASFQMKMLIAQLILRYSLACPANPDIYHFDCPLFLTVLPYAPTYITFKRLL